MRKGIGTLTLSVIFSVLMLVLVITVFGYKSIPVLGDISFNSCWNEVKAITADIVYRLEGPRLPVVEKTNNKTFIMGNDCSTKIVFVNHDDFIKDKNYRVFWTTCTVKEEGSYILSYPKFPQGIEDKKWWQLRPGDLKDELSKMSATKWQNINPSCNTLSKPFSSSLNGKVLESGKQYCLEFPERKGTVEEYDFKVKEGKC